MGKRSGFTLIELLVVIAIIAMLLAILMPALQRVKKQAKSAACKVTLHQWALIWSMYCDDNDGKFCRANITTPGGGNLGWRRGTWIIALRPQWRTKTDLLRCPMATKPHPSGANRGGTFNTYRMGTGGLGDLQEDCSYGANCWLYNPAPGVTVIQQRPAKWNWKTPDVQGTNNIPVFADTMWRGGGPFSGEAGTDRIPERGEPPDYDGQWVRARDEMKHFCINRHNGSVNHLFMDWSTRTVGLKELWTLKWHRAFNTAGPWTRAGGVTPSSWPQWMRGFKDY